MLGTARYITATELKDNTTITAIKTMSDTDREVLIVQAQLVIDGYLDTVNGESVNDDTLYPVYLDKDALTVDDIPVGIQQATVMVVDWIYNNGGFGKYGEVGAVAQETTGPHTVRFSDSYLADIQKSGLPSYITNILDRYRLSLVGNVL